MAIERKVLSINYPKSIRLQQSFHLKLCCIVVEIVLVIVCGASMFEGHWKVSVIAEWIIGLIFTFYIWSCAIDFLTTNDLHKNNTKDGKLTKQRWNDGAGISVPQKTRDSQCT